MKAPLIVKWRYWTNNSSSTAKASTYLNYISTREGAEKYADGWKSLKATKKQVDIINALLTDISNAEKSYEYKRYCSQKTRGAASEFISSVFENSPEMMTGKTYLDYIGTRPRAERLGATALFSDEGKSLDLEEEKEKLNKFFKWGIVFPKEVYTVADKGNRKVIYADKKEIEKAIEQKYPRPAMTEKDEEMARGEKHVERELFFCQQDKQRDYA